MVEEALLKVKLSNKVDAFGRTLGMFENKVKPTGHITLEELVGGSMKTAVRSATVGASAERQSRNGQILH